MAYRPLYERDGESGWDYRGARYYSADEVRFLSVDPRAYDYTEWSPNNYVLANPILLVDPDGRSPDCCPWAEFAVGFADRAAQISFPAYGVYRSVATAPQTVSGLYGHAAKLVSGQGTLTDYLALFDISGTARTINQVQHIRELYDAGEYQQLGVMAYDAIVGVVAMGAELQPPRQTAEKSIYRGSDSNPSSKFKDGFTAKGNNYDLWDHVSNNPKNSGYISTSKLRENAATYGDFVYEIRAQKNGIDVNEKFGTNNKYHYENEISVPDKIPASDIRGVYPVNSDGTLGDFMPNPYFK